MQKETRVYLDSNAGAPLHPSVKEALLLFFSQSNLQSKFPANPSSPHTEGKFSKKLINEARDKIAASINAAPNQIIFTSSGTEANQLAIRSTLDQALAERSPVSWLLTTAEHDSTWKLAQEYESKGIFLQWLPINRHGVWQEVGDTHPSPTLVSLLWANNETGVINALEERTQAIKARFPKTKIHVDAVQAWGKLPIDMQKFQAVDFMSFSGHKIGAPAGIGALWVKQPSELHPVLVGSQEYGKRGGTENLLGIHGLGIAASQINPPRWANELQPMQQLLEKLIQDELPGATVLGEDAPRISNTTEIIIPGIKNNDLIVALDIEGFAVSSGAACSSGIATPSRVALAMGFSPADAACIIRISQHDGIREKDLRNFVFALKRCAETLKRG